MRKQVGFCSLVFTAFLLIALSLDMDILRLRPCRRPLWQSQASWFLAWWLGNILISLLACWVLLSGFCFAGTLRFECVLARWLLDAGILGIFATRSQVYGAHGCHLACLVSLLWRPGGPWDDPGTILGHWRAQGRTL